MYALFLLFALAIALLHLIRFRSMESFVEATHDTYQPIPDATMNDSYMDSVESEYVEAEIDVEPFVTESTEESKALQFVSPLNIVANEMSLEGDENTFMKESKFDNSKTIFEDDIILHSESTIRIGESTLSKKDLVPIKKSISKLQFIRDKSSDLTSFKDGEQKDFSSKKTGNNECSAVLWKILMNEEVSQKDMCVACCKKKPGDADDVDVSIVYRGKVNSLQIDGALSQVYDVKQIDLNSECIVSLYKTTVKDCRLVLFHSTKSFFNREEIVAEITKKQKDSLDNTVLELSDEKEWGELVDGVVVSKMYRIPISRKYNWAFVEVLD